MSPARREESDADAEGLREMLGGYRITQLLHVAARFGIADVLADGPRTADELAARVGASPDALFRVLRSLAAIGVLASADADDPQLPPRERRFRLTDLGEPLRRDHPDSVHPFAVSYGEPWWWDVYGRLEHSVRTGQTAFEHAYGVGLFEYLSLHPEAEEIFAANMTAMTEREARAVDAAWDLCETGTLVDVGGGEGALLARLLASRPGLRGILYDLPTVVEDAGEPLRRAGVAERCELRGGSFFEAVPEGGDVYVLKDVLHDWDDAECGRILDRCRQAMPAGARLVAVERRLPPGDEPAAAKLIDVNMLVLTGGRERTREEYEELFERAGLEPVRTIATSSDLALMVAEAS